MRLNEFLFVVVVLTLCSNCVLAAQTEGSNLEYVQRDNMVQNIQTSTRQNKGRTPQRLLNQQMDILQSGIDSVQRGINNIVNNIDETTRQIQSNTSFDTKARVAWWLAIVAFVVSVFSMIYAILTYYAQKNTEIHTTNAPISVQQWKLMDLPRHFYRNLVCTCSLILKFRNEKNNNKRNWYPSESNLRKLQTLPDDIVLPIDVDKNKDAEHNAYRYMHELRLLLRNYNVEVEVASEHLSRKGLDDETLKQDFDNLLFKPIQLIINTFSFERELPFVTANNLVVRTIYAILKEHFKKLSIASNFDLLMLPESVKYLDQILKDNCANFRKLVDKKEGVDRSVDNLLSEGVKEEMQRFKESGKNGNVEEGALLGIHCYKKDNYENEKEDEVEYEKFEAIIEKRTAVDYISFLLNSEKHQNLDTPNILIGKYTEDGQQIAPGIVSICSVEQFVAFYNEFFHVVPKTDEKKLYKLYNHIVPYLNYLSSDNWKFHTLLKYIIAIDASIESDRIGMVNYC